MGNAASSRPYEPSLSTVARVALLALVALCALGLLSASSGPRSAGVTAWLFNLKGMAVFAAGLGIGCYGTLVGIGGGALIVPVLVFFYDWPARNVVGTALLVVLLNAASGTSGYALQRRIDYQGGLKFALAALPGSVFSGLVHRVWKVESFNTIFGLFLVGLAIFCVLGVGSVDARPATIPVEGGESFRLVSLRDRFGARFRFRVDDRVGTSLNFILGFLVGFLGIGGGVLQVPILVFALGYPVHIATATSHFITMLTCTYALAPNIAFGNVYFGQAAWLGVGVLGGAQIGAWLSPKIRSARIIHLFVLVVFVFGVRLLLQ